jgi:hypothetical protein
MDTQEYDLIPPPPGIFLAFKDGYQAISSHLVAILFPIALDLFLWLGPHLNISGFVKAYFDFARKFGPGPMTTDQLANQKQMLEVVKHYNLFSMLSTFPIGNPSLLSGKPADLTPFGSPITIPLASPLELLAWVLPLTLLGWLVGGLYLNAVARAVLPAAEGSSNRIGFGRAVVQSVTLSLIWTVILIMVGIPGMVVFALLGLINMAIAQTIFLVVVTFGVWLILPVYFSPHGIFVRKQNALHSILSGIQMVRYTLPTSSLFLMGVFLITMATNWLWTVPDSNSWLLLIGIAGHGFVTSMLLASSFIYYRNMSEWLQAAFERLRTKAPRPSQ